ncbi:MAG: hypothetical protein ACTSRZ_15600 [Promethearchaeota archaeon]
MKEQIEENDSLKDIVYNYLKRKFDFRILNEKIKGESGQKWKFDGVINYNNQKIGVVVKDWGRFIGINQIRLVEKACYDVGFSGGVIFGNNFSGNAKHYGKNRGLKIISRIELQQKLNL